MPSNFGRTPCPYPSPVSSNQPPCHFYLREIASGNAALIHQRRKGVPRSQTRAPQALLKRCADKSPPPPTSRSPRCFRECTILQGPDLEGAHHGGTGLACVRLSQVRRDWDWRARASEWLSSSQYPPLRSAGIVFRSRVVDKAIPIIIIIIIIGGALSRSRRGNGLVGRHRQRAPTLLHFLMALPF
jgi:hypothetical protein